MDFERGFVLERFKAMLEDAPVAVYISAVGTYEILYYNKHAKAIFKNANNENIKKCYELSGKKMPCEFCHVDKMTYDSYFEREYCSEVDNCIYHMNGKLIDWNGRPAHIEYISDVTDRVLLEKSLESTNRKMQEVIIEKARLEKYFKNIIEQLPGGVIVFSVPSNKNFVPEFISEGFANMLNMSLEYVQSQCREDIFAGVFKEDVENVRAFFDECLSGESEQKEMTYRIYKGKNDYIWIKNSLSVFKDKRGKIKIYSMFNDITKEYRRKERLNARYRKMLLQYFSTPGPNVIMTCHCNVSQNKVIDINNCKDVLKLKDDNKSLDRIVLEMSHFIVEKEARKSFLEKFNTSIMLMEFYEGVSTKKYECFVKLPCNKIGCYISVAVHLVKMPDDGDIGGILNITDITEEIMTERVLHRLSEDGYDFVVNVDLINDSYSLLPAEKNYPQMEKLQYRYSSALKDLFENRVMSTDLTVCKRNFDKDYMLKRLSEEGAYSFSYSIKEDSGEVNVKNVTVFAIDLALGRVCLTRTDITKMLASEMMAKKRLKEALAIATEANKAKVKFLSSMSHDIRTPMNAIIGMTDLALAGIDNIQQVSESLEIIKLSSEQLLRLINNILDMSRIESGKMVLSNDVFSHKTEMRNLLLSTRVLADKKDIKLIFEEFITHDKCVGDITKIRRVLENILGNAIKFTENGGVVRFCVEEMEAKNESVGRYKFTVSDTGIGMTKDCLEHIFEPFYRDENSKARCIEGTGLGLPIVKNILDYMGGIIKFESLPEVGTTCVVELPLKFERDYCDGVLKNDIEYGDMNLSGMKVLLVEDNDINRMVAGAILENMNAEVVVAGNGREGLEIFEQSHTNEFSAICMDLQMPILNGYEATIAIRKSSHAQALSIPIIAMTADAFSGDVHKCLEVGMNAHIAKPIEPNKLFILLKSFSK